MAPPLGLLDVIDNMAAHLQSVDVCRRQSDDVTRWRLRIEEALMAAAAVEGATAGFTCNFYGSQTHKTWLLTSWSIVFALREQEAQAEAIREEAQAAAAAAGAAAAAAEATASEEYAAAGAAESGSADEAQHLAAGAAAEQEAATARADQAAAEARAQAAERWREAAAEAAAFGEAFIPREDNIHRPVGEAVAGAGGLPEVALEKRYHVVGG
jgi:hypothetical protein